MARGMFRVGVHDLLKADIESSGRTERSTMVSYRGLDDDKEQ